MTCHTRIIGVVLVALILLGTAYPCDFIFAYEIVPPRFSVVFYNGDVPIRNSVVMLFKQQGRNEGPKQALKSTATDRNGRVEFANLEPGFYEINIQDGDTERRGLHVEVRSTEKSRALPLEYRFPPAPKLAYPVTLRSLTGTVFDETGAVMPNVKVTIESPEFSTPRQILTDGRGNFSVSVPDGEYVLIVESVGFARAKIPVVVSKKKEGGWRAAAITLKVAPCGLQEASPYALKELEAV